MRLLGNVLCQEDCVINVHIYTLLRFCSVTLNSSVALCVVLLQRPLKKHTCRLDKDIAVFHRVKL